MTGARAAILAACLAGTACGGGEPGPERVGPVATAPAHPAWFTDATVDAGLAGFRQVNGAPEKLEIVEAIGAGVAFLDHDRDGDIDVYLTNGSSLDGFTEGQEPRDALYRNDGGGRFTDVSAASGVGDTGWTNGVTVADYDGDGWVDVYLTNFGPNVLLRNRGDGRFEDVTARAGVGDPRWSTGACFFDADGDGDLDLYVANYIEHERGFQPQDKSTCQYRGIMVAYGPRGLEPAPDTFYRNRGDGTFEDATREAGIVDPGYYGFTAVALDFDFDGDLDVYVANDSVANFLWRNDGHGHFTDVAVSVGAGLSEEGKAQAGMGVAVGDSDGDGLLDLWVTNFADDYYTLYRNEGRGFFADVTSLAGLRDPTWPFMGWGCGFADFDRDGDSDLFAVNGHTYPQVDEVGVGLGYAQRALLLENDGTGRYRDATAEAGPGLEARLVGRGAAFGDYDDDGDVDVLIGVIDGPPILLRNDGDPGRAWLSVELVGTAPNTGALGAFVTLTAGGRRQVRTMLSGESFLSANDPRLHFGLGEARRVERIEIRWPDGVTEIFGPFEARQRVRVVRGTGTIERAPAP